MGTSNKIFNICKLFRNLSASSSSKIMPIDSFAILARPISTSSPRRGLMEFFDDKKNWGEHEVKSGRSWKVEEMRLKSNTDLHKLWYVLLKERNMLLTMEQEAMEQMKLFPNPERLDKVEESMENLETVVRERNRAYHELETGETGERPGKLETNPLGLRRYRKLHEYPLPKHMNKQWLENAKTLENHAEVEQFLLKYREKLYLSKRRAHVRNFNHVIGLLNRFPNMDMEALKEKYPDVDIEKAKRSRRYGGHFAPK